MLGTYVLNGVKILLHNPHLVVVAGVDAGEDVVVVAVAAKADVDVGETHPAHKSLK